MVVYRNSSKAPLKWLVAIIIFLLAMTITWSDVEGKEIGSAQPEYGSDTYCVSSTSSTGPGLMCLTGKKNTSS